MQTLLVVLGALLPYAVWANNMQLPVGKCRYPLPSYRGLNITSMAGDVFKYIYTPNAMIYKAVDSISMQLRKDNQKNVYTEVIKARSILGTQTNMKFKVKDLGDGILKKITTEDDDVSYVASIVDIKKDVAMLYVCSDEGEDIDEDFRYVIGRKWVNPDEVKHPNILFKATNLKYKFRGKFRKLPQRWSKKLY